ncbi:hypothetical protein [Neolewinella antarctica]|uniref:Uncharacterized protein n=1 Tax=Neolewinella antarctica TaxID=442734 RepID=A0ABX0XBV7_9BACT|nr:hypothetical protein [Neolewinella antarctica]NJC26413.1 hypothetical protein [Neolewinella antarctica]
MYTEQQIRGLAINFLRQHYKLRPRSGTSGTRVVPNVHYYRGVTIDARLAFQQPDLEWFTATVEATSLDTGQEVLYRKNWFGIFAYALLFGLAAVAVFLALSPRLSTGLTYASQPEGFNVWRWAGGAPAYGMLFFGFLILTCVAALALSIGKGFRYIYAVDQFKRFYANAQWMAYDKEVFQDLPPRYFAEFQSQCIRYGFGMMEILPGNRVRDVMEPSHIDQFSGKRAQLPLWVAAIQPPPKLRSLVKSLPFPKRPASTSAPTPTDGYTDPLDVGTYLPAQTRQSDYVTSILHAKKGRPKWYQRPARRIAHARWLLRDARRKFSPDEIRRRPGYFSLRAWYYPSLIGVLLTLVTFGVLQASWSPFAKLGSRFETPDVAGLEPAANPAQSRASPDLLPGEYDHNFDADNRPAGEVYLDADRDVPADNPPRTVLRYRVDQAGESRTDYECLSLAQLPSTYYLLTTGVYPDFTSARDAADNINALYSMAVTVAAEECLRTGGGKYFVYLDAPVVEESQANFLVRGYLRRYDLAVEVLVVE